MAVILLFSLTDELVDHSSHHPISFHLQLKFDFIHTGFFSMSPKSITYLIKISFNGFTKEQELRYFRLCASLIFI